MQKAKQKEKKKINNSILLSPHWTTLFLIAASVITLQGLFIEQTEDARNNNFVPYDTGEGKGVCEERLTYNYEPGRKTEDIIRQLARVYGVREAVALRIGYCESRYDAMAKNKASSASGVYQFINKTWESYCAGEVFNAHDNVKCFMELYPKYPQWWECK